MKHTPTIAAALLGLAFITFGLNHFLKFLSFGGSAPSNPLAPLFFQSVGKSGFLDFVKVIEIIGGILVILPKTRNWGLLALGPIVVGILATNIFIVGGASVFQPPVILIAALSAFLLWTARDKFLNLLND